jgi:hypothetical protein
MVVYSSAVPVSPRRIPVRPPGRRSAAGNVVASGFRRKRPRAGNARCPASPHRGADQLHAWWCDCLVFHAYRCWAGRPRCLPARCCRLDFVLPAAVNSFRDTGRRSDLHHRAGSTHATSD